MLLCHFDFPIITLIILCFNHNIMTTVEILLRLFIHSVSDLRKDWVESVSLVLLI